MIKDIVVVSSSSKVELGSVEVEISVRVESDEIELVSGMFDDEEDRSEVWLVSPTEELDKIGVIVVVSSDERVNVSVLSSVTVLVCEVVTVSVLLSSTFKVEVDMVVVSGRSA